MTDDNVEVTKIVLATPSQDPKLPPYGQPAAWEAPADRCIWGARFIFPDDMVYNRQGFNDQDEGELKAWLNTGPGEGGNRIVLAGEAAVRLAGEGKIRQSSKEVVTLFEDEQGIIRGNPNGSYGYLYVAAWLKPVAPLNEGVNQ